MPLRYLCILATRRTCAVLCTGNMYKVIYVFCCFFFNAHGYKYNKVANVKINHAIRCFNIRMLTKFWFALHVTYDKSFSEDPRGAPRPGGSECPATLAVNRGIFLGAPRPVEGHRRHWPPWPSIISYPDIINKCTINLSMRQNLWLKID